MLVIYGTYTEEAAFLVSGVFVFMFTITYEIENIKRNLDELYSRLDLMGEISKLRERVSVLERLGKSNKKKGMSDAGFIVVIIIVILLIWVLKTYGYI